MMRNGPPGWPLMVVVWLILAFLVLPCLLVIPMSFSDTAFLEFPPRGLSLRWYRDYLASPDWMAATAMSLKLALSTTALATLIGVPAAYGLALLPKRWALSLRGLFLVPMTVPVILIAVALYIAFSQVALTFTFTGLLIAHTLVALPFVVIAAGNGFASFDFAQERVARTLGASWPVAVATVTLPQVLPAILSGMLFAFIASFDEAVISLFLSSGSTTTLTKRMFETIRDEMTPTVAAVSSLLILFSLLALLLNEIAQARLARARQARAAPQES